MDDFDNKLNIILNSWNSTAKQKGDDCYYLAKQEGLSNRERVKCVDLAIEKYENTSDDTCLCNLSHCYFIKGSFCSKKDEANEYFRKSIETHIKGSEQHRYKEHKFYKFYSVSDTNIVSILKKIRLSKPSEFNDPIDCPIVQDFSDNPLFLDKTIFDGLRVCCFGVVKSDSENNDVFWADAKKWAYYGDKHRGICICYHFLPNTFEKELSNQFVFDAVKYKPVFSFYKGIVADGFLSKSIHYEEENEWRIIWYKRFFKRKYKYLSINENNITDIYIGCKCKDSIISKIIDYVKNSESAIRVFKVHPNNDNPFEMTKTLLWQ